MNFLHDKGDGVETKTWNVNLINLKVGVTDSSDVQLVAGFVRQIDYVGGLRTATNSFSDVTLRFKQNFVGNDGGTFAFGMMPFVKIPTAKEPVGNKKVEGGLLLPWSLELPAGFEFGSMFQFNAARNGANDGYQEETIFTATLGHSIYGGLAGFVEGYGALGSENGSQLEATVDLGLTFEFVKNWQLDAGMFFGVTDAAPDYQPFLGLSAKI